MFIKHVRILLILFLFFLSVSGLFSQELIVQHSDENQLILKIETVNNNNFSPVLISFENLHDLILRTRYTGRMFAVPPGKTSVLSITVDEYKIINDPVLVGDYLLNREKTGLNKETNLSTVKLSNKFLPEIPEAATKLGTFRGLPVNMFNVPLIQYNPIKNEIRLNFSFTVKIVFSKKSDKPGTYRRIRPFAGDVSGPASNFINYPTAGKWMNPGPLANKASAINTNSWFDPDNEYLKIYTDTLNIYRITYSDLQDYGFNPSLINPSTFCMYNRGEEFPCYVHGESDGIFSAGDYIEFTGDWNRGTAEYFDYFTDYNAYWLTWGGSQGLRPLMVSSLPVTETKADFFTDTLHYEKDNFYNQAISYTTNRMTELTKGEGWFDSQITAGQTKHFYTKLPGINTDSNLIETAFKVQGLSDDPGAELDHLLEFYVNDNLIGSSQYKAFEDPVFRFTVQRSLFADDTNKISIRIPSTGLVDRTLFNSMEFVYSRKFYADKNRLKFSIPENSTSRFSISGFDSENISVYSVNGRKKYTGFSVSQLQEFYTLDVELSDPIVKNFIAGIPAKPDSMEKTVFPNLLSSDNAADYLIITHPEFLEEAGEFADYRQQKENYPAGIKIVSVFDIYNEFNYGVESVPVIRDFLRYTLENWQTAPSYLLLFGDASLDYRNRRQFKNFVPSYGAPSSDNWFVNVDGSSDMIPDMVLGRIPVKTREEADGYLEKLRDYETPASELWRKKTLFLNGGMTEGNQQTIILHQALTLKNSYLEPAPVGGFSVFFNKVTDKFIEKDFKDQIIEEINSGCIWVNTMGHGAVSTYDISFGEPEHLNNYKKYPFMISMSCQTLKFNFPYNNSLGEEYILIPDKGGIGYFGTTGWGEMYRDNYLIDGLFKAVFQDTVYNLSQASEFARLRLLQNYDISQSTKNLVQQYTYIGDPAMRIALPEKPDLSITDDNIKLLTEAPNNRDSVMTVRLYIDNPGLATSDSCKVTIHDKYLGEQTYIAVNINLTGPILLRDSIDFDIPIFGKTGEHEIGIQINPLNEIDESDYSNNTASKTILVFRKNLLILKPVRNAVVHERSINLTLASGKQKESDAAQIFFEVDTSRNFDGPLFSSDGIPDGSFITEYSISPSLDKTWYYWRVRSFDGADFSSWVYSSFYTDFTNTLEEKWSQSGEIFNDNNSINLCINDGLKLDTGNFTLEVISAGFHVGDKANIYVNNSEPDYQLYNSPDNNEDEYQQGFFCAEFDPDAGIVVRAMKFNTYRNTEHGEGLADFVEAIPDGNILLAGVKDSGTSVKHILSERAIKAIAEIGGSRIYEIGHRVSYALIAERGNSENIFEDVKAPLDDSVKVTYTVTTFIENGWSETYEITGVNSWNHFSWSAGTGTDGSILYTVNGFNNNLQKWEILREDSINTGEGGISLSGIDPDVYRRIKLKCLLTRGSLYSSPVLKSWGLDFEPAGNVTVNSSLVSFEKDTLNQGETQQAEIQIYNSGFCEIDTVEVSIIRKASGAEIPLSGSPFLVTSLKPDSVRTLTAEICTGKIRLGQELVWQVNPGNKISELSYDDNFAEGSYYIYPDISFAEIDVTFDGREILNNDYVSKNPEITLIIKENNPTAVLDTSQISISLNDVQIPLENNPHIEYSKNVSSGNTIVEIIYKPILTDGNHILKIGVTDDSENYSEEIINFRVQTKLDIFSVYNFPNPCTESTHFTYILTQPAEEVSLKIYTVNGRLIFRSDYLPGNAGFNKLYWDLRDNAGDKPSNGVYIYTVSAKQGDESARVLQKIAITR